MSKKDFTYKVGNMKINPQVDGSKFKAAVEDAQSQLQKSYKKHLTIPQLIDEKVNFEMELLDLLREKFQDFENRTGVHIEDLSLEFKQDILGNPCPSKLVNIHLDLRLEK